MTKKVYDQIRVFKQDEKIHLIGGKSIHLIGGKNIHLIGGKKIYILLAGKILSCQITFSLSGSLVLVIWIQGINVAF